MARCSSCNKACQCTVADDGFYALEVGDDISPELIGTTRTGRRSTVVQGQGTLSNPFTVSFIDSDFYQANAFEYRSFTSVVGSPTVPVLDVAQVQYSVFPYQMRLDVPIPVGSQFASEGAINISSSNNLIAGFYVDLSTGGISLSVRAQLNYDPPASDGGIEVICGDNTVRANPALASMGFVSPLRGIDTISAGLIGTLFLQISGYPTDPTINEARIWAAWV